MTKHKFAFAIQKLCGQCKKAITANHICLIHTPKQKLIGFTVKK